MNKAKEYQDKLFKEILAFFKQNPYRYFVAREITKELGINGGDNYWFAHGHLKVLKDMGELEKGPHGKGFKYKKAS